MTQSAPQFGPTAQKILAHLQQQPGTPFAAADVCETVDCTLTEAQTALEALAGGGLIERREGASGVVTYSAR